MICGDCGCHFRLVNTGQKYEYWQCPCGAVRKVERAIPLSKVLKPYLWEMEVLEQAYRRMGLYD